MRNARTVVRRLFLPVACFAAAGWALGFGISYAMLPNRDLGTAVLLAFAGALLLLPWLLMALGIFQRMRAGEASEHADEHHDKGTHDAS
ncbi:MAG TPA: hypothetical protein VK753_09885 [Xanthomonadaceae bacterium]|jgi:hypothetical protein|nr:hypothetical protein [Xanthomonadaceae bacterium]